MRSVKWPPANVDPSYLAEYRRLDLVHYNRWLEIIRPQSSGAADPAVQAYNMRTLLTSDPANRVPVEKPAGYDRDALLRRLETDVRWTSKTGNIPGTVLPNRKTYWNRPQLIGVQNAYVEGGWDERRRVTREHVEFTRRCSTSRKTTTPFQPRSVTSGASGDFPRTSSPTTAIRPTRSTCARHAASWAAPSSPSTTCVRPTG